MSSPTGQIIIKLLGSHRTKWKGKTMEPSLCGVNIFRKEEEEEGESGFEVRTIGKVHGAWQWPVGHHKYLWLLLRESKGHIHMFYKTYYEDEKFL